MSLGLHGDFGGEAPARAEILQGAVKSTTNQSFPQHGMVVPACCYREDLYLTKRQLKVPTGYNY